MAELDLNADIRAKFDHTISLPQRRTNFTCFFLGGLLARVWNREIISSWRKVVRGGGQLTWHDELWPESGSCAPNNNQDGMSQPLLRKSYLGSLPQIKKTTHLHIIFAYFLWSNEFLFAKKSEVFVRLCTVLNVQSCLQMEFVSQSIHMLRLKSLGQTDTFYWWRNLNLN